MMEKQTPVKAMLVLLLLHVLCLGGHAEALCEGRVVKVPVGPLVSVEGQAASLRCDVSDYEGPRDQDFEWTMLQAGKELQVVSTFDSAYPDALLRDRVSSGDISIKKLSNSSVELKIKKVRATDSATYRCNTPSTDTTVKGNYFADVALKVIGDSLRVALSIPKPVVSEGDQLELHCNTTRAFTEHTSLSVTWSHKKAGSPASEILTFGPDDKVTVAAASAERYADGGLRLDLRGGGFYGLVLSGARPEDQGKYVCTAREWVRQAGGSLDKILEKSEEMGKVTVKPGFEAISGCMVLVIRAVLCCSALLLTYWITKCTYQYRSEKRGKGNLRNSDEL
ncbi:immunoglobulin superfamily member 8-like isoform X2 [Alosa sapidissima]|uniref:immunoglobulin superfamily member 8-like isoform X2 n=1 Tax=Alosa sapidissima TaxID=34773 RepID=UPI001C088A06|nr:immunoglobulin superfamily member 8-like isoform X2 [Alosa sapidissima]